MQEKLYDKPEWLRVRGYREARPTRKHRKQAELLLRLGTKDYWFPATPSVYEKFIAKAKSESRGAALRYLQDYIRRYRKYRGVWPDPAYVEKNKISDDSFMERDALIADYARRTGATVEDVSAILTMRGRGFSTQLIARKLHIGVPMVEHVLNLVLQTEAPVTDIPAFEDLIDGEINLSEMKGATPSDTGQTMRALRGEARGNVRYVKVKGQKPRSAPGRVV